MCLFSAKGSLRYLLREYESLSYSSFNVKQRKKKKKDFLALNFRLAAPINLRFKKAQQLTVSNAFPVQDFIRT
jgi:hypothetical protein